MQNQAVQLLKQLQNYLQCPNFFQFRALYKPKKFAYLELWGKAEMTFAKIFPWQKLPKCKLI